MSHAKRRRRWRRQVVSVGEENRRFRAQYLFWQGPREDSGVVMWRWTIENQSIHFWTLCAPHPNEIGARYSHVEMLPVPVNSAVRSIIHVLKFDVDRTLLERRGWKNLPVGCRLPNVAISISKLASYSHAMEIILMDKLIVRYWSGWIAQEFIHHISKAGAVYVALTSLCAFLLLCFGESLWFVGEAAQILMVTGLFG